SSLSSGEYLPGSLQGKISSDGCLKKEQMVVSAIASTPQLSVFRLTGNQKDEGPDRYFYQPRPTNEHSNSDLSLLPAIRQGERL
ncbi:hypothetical protein, partial [Escherichia coli]|uniref:hypothetical protein n=1 Tax=Escherichia coli TaxID=562 RepID=UPI0019D5A130